jgi:hypothetical protein
MGGLIQALADRYAAAQDSNVKLSVTVYSLNAESRKIGSFDELSPAWRDGRRMKMPASRRYAVDDITSGLKRNHREALAAREQANRQDVSRAIRTFVNSRMEYFGAGTRGVHVLFLSDMLHYTSGMRDTDALRGRFNLADTFSRQEFARKIAADTLPPTTSLARVSAEIPLDVYSIRVPRCVDEPWSGGATPNFDEIYGSVDQIWQDVFRRLGASRSELGRTSVDGIIPS